MITVLVWKPTTALSLGGRKDFYEGNQYLLDKISNTKQTQLTQPILDTTELLNIKVVGKMGADTFFRSFGHVAIEVEYLGRTIYGSFYPSMPKSSDIKLIFPFMAFNSRFSTYEEDLENMKSGPDHRILIDKLNSSNAYRFLSNLGPEWRSYNLYSRNCATLVMKTLQISTADIEISTWSSLKYSASQFYDKAKEIFNLLSLFTPAPNFTNTTGYNFNSYNYNYDYFKWRTTKADPIKAIFGSCEALGALTPYKAMNYARFLQKEIG